MHALINKMLEYYCTTMPRRDGRIRVSKKISLRTFPAVCVGTREAFMVSNPIIMLV